MGEFTYAIAFTKEKEYNSALDYLEKEYEKYSEVIKRIKEGVNKK